MASQLEQENRALIAELQLCRIALREIRKLCYDQNFNPLPKRHFYIDGWAAMALREKPEFLKEAPVINQEKTA